MQHWDLSLGCAGFSHVWDSSSRPGMEPVSPALQGGFLATGPPGKSSFLT